MSGTGVFGGRVFLVGESVSHKDGVSSVEITRWIDGVKKTATLSVGTLKEIDLDHSKLTTEELLVEQLDSALMPDQSLPAKSFVWHQTVSLTGDQGLQAMLGATLSHLGVVTGTSAFYGPDLKSARFVGYRVEMNEKESGRQTVGYYNLDASGKVLKATWASGVAGDLKAIPGVVRAVGGETALSAESLKLWQTGGLSSVSSGVVSTILNFDCLGALLTSDEMSAMKSQVGSLFGFWEGTRLFDKDGSLLVSMNAFTSGKALDFGQESEAVKSKIAEVNAKLPDGKKITGYEKVKMGTSEYIKLYDATGKSGFLLNGNDLGMLATEKVIGLQGWGEQPAALALILVNDEKVRQEFGCEATLRVTDLEQGAAPEKLPNMKSIDSFENWSVKVSGTTAGAA